MTATLDALHVAGVLSALDVHFARAMGRIAGESRPEVLLAAALVSRQVSNGHVCLDLPQVAGGAALVDDSGTPLALQSWPSLHAWRATLRSSPLIGASADITPLVLDDADRLSLRRYWAHQERLAAVIQARSVEADTVVDRAWLGEALDRLFPVDSAVAGDLDWQRMAAVRSMGHAASLIRSNLS